MGAYWTVNNFEIKHVFTFAYFILHSYFLYSLQLVDTDLQKNQNITWQTNFNIMHKSFKQFWKHVLVKVGLTWKYQYFVTFLWKIHFFSRFNFIETSEGCTIHTLLTNRTFTVTVISPEISIDNEYQKIC